MLGKGERSTTRMIQTGDGDTIEIYNHEKLKENGNPSRPLPLAIRQRGVIRSRAKGARNLFPDDCYIKHTAATKKNYLADEDDLDMVARLENAELAGINIPWEFTPLDLCTTYIPSRRTLAFGYAVLRADVGDNFKKAAKIARIPQSWRSYELYQNLRTLQFLSSFWEERIRAMRGIAFIYVDKHSRKGSAPHMKLMNEMTELTKPENGKPTSATQINISIPELAQANAKTHGHVLPPGKYEEDDFEIRPS